MIYFVIHFKDYFLCILFITWKINWLITFFMRLILWYSSIFKMNSSSWAPTKISNPSILDNFSNAISKSVVLAKFHKNIFFASSTILPCIHNYCYIRAFFHNKFKYYIYYLIYLKKDRMFCKNINLRVIDYIKKSLKYFSLKFYFLIV